MTIYDVISRFRRHPLVLEEVSMTANVGLPYLFSDCRFGETYLYARFLLHKEYLRENRWFIESPTQIVEVCCETGRIKRYEVRNGFVPGYELYISDVRKYIRSSVEPLQALYQKCDEVLKAFEEERTVGRNRRSSFMERNEKQKSLYHLIEDYQELFRETVEELGQEELYGIMYDPEA